MRNIPWKLENPQKITESEIAALEERFCFRMPEDLRQFYLRQNGGLFPTGTVVNPERSRLNDFLAVKFPFMERLPLLETILDRQEQDGFIPMCYIPFCSDEAGDSYYIRVDEAGYGEIYYIFSEFLDDFPGAPESEGLIANSFTEFLEMIQFPEEKKG